MGVEPSTGARVHSEPVTAAGVQVDAVLNDVRYRSDDPATVGDWYRPVVRGPGPHPAVVAIHGGAWRSGDKWALSSYAKRFAAAGIGVFAINYRLAPEHQFPAALDDVRDAIHYLIDHSEELDLDADRLGLFGYSAGGHLALLAGMTTRESPPPIRESSPIRRSFPVIRAVVAGGAVTDFRGVPIDATLFDYFLGGTRRQRPDVYEAASPAAHVTVQCPPTLLYHGGSDLVVQVDMSRQLAARLEAAGVEHELVIYRPLGHGLTFLHPGAAGEATRFLVEHLQPSN